MPVASRRWALRLAQSAELTAATVGSGASPLRPRVHDQDPPALDAVWESWSWPSRLDRKDDMVDAVVQALEARCRLAEDDPHWLRLCLDEALVNAIVHGNEADPGVPVRAVLGRRGDAWVVRIDDQGPGFDASQVPDPEDPASLLLEHGRGIRLMLEWLDELAFYRRGASSWMARRLG